MIRLLRYLRGVCRQWRAFDESPELPRRSTSLFIIERIGDSTFDCLGGRYRLILLRVTVYAESGKQIWYRCRAERCWDGKRIATRTHSCPQIAESQCRHAARRWQRGKVEQHAPERSTSLPIL